VTRAATDARGESTGLLEGPGLVAAARTDRGPVREENQDAFVCRPDLGLFAVIDGMGGHQGGQTAATLMRETLLAEPDLEKALATANARILTRAQRDPDLAGMGCVVSALRLANDGARVAHVGDTRIYLTGDLGCEQLTRDHTVAAVRQEEMGVSEGRARDLGGHNQVTRDVGGRLRDGGEWIDRLEIALEPDDLLVLCSDGLHGALSRDDLMSRLRQARRDGAPCEALAEELVELALANGTRDNVTAVVVRCLERVGWPAGRPTEGWLKRLWKELSQ
jgi:protein phosphatase